MLLVYIAVGGALGALARYGLSGWVHGWAPAAVPWGTFAVNALGSLLIGFAVRTLEGLATPVELRGLIAVGFLGAFTTFSTYSYETVTLLQGGEWRRAAAYALGSLLVGLFGVVVGFGLAAVLLRQGG